MSREDVLRIVDESTVIKAAEGETYRALIGPEPGYDEDENWVDERVPSGHFLVVGPKCDQTDVAGFWPTMKPPCRRHARTRSSSRCTTSSSRRTRS